jgi:hypothetical protein
MFAWNFGDCPFGLFTASGNRGFGVSLQQKKFFETQNGFITNPHLDL